MAEIDFEQRFAGLESRIAELEHQRAVQEERDIALLARIDNFIDDLRRIERVQMRAFDAQAARLKAIESDIKALTQSVTILADVSQSHKQAIETLAETARDHKAGIESVATIANNSQDAIKSLAQQVATLAAGQQQIITILTGNKPPRND